MDLAKHPQVILRRSSTCHTCRKAPVSPLPHHFRRGEYIHRRTRSPKQHHDLSTMEEGIYLCVGKIFLKVLTVFVMASCSKLDSGNCSILLGFDCRERWCVRHWLPHLCHDYLRLARQFSMFSRIPIAAIAFKCSLAWAKKKVVPKMTIWILYQ